MSPSHERHLPRRNCLQLLWPAAAPNTTVAPSHSRTIAFLGSRLEGVAHFSMEPSPSRYRMETTPREAVRRCLLAVHLSLKCRRTQVPASRLCWSGCHPHPCRGDVPSRSSSVGLVATRAAITGEFYTSKDSGEKLPGFSISCDISRNTVSFAF